MKAWTCAHCGEPFERSRPDQNSQKHCSAACRWAAKVQVPADAQACWTWNGAVASSGYGAMKVDGRTVNAHRFSAERHGISLQAVVRHSCDNKLCVNPLHLESGTQAENVADTVDRGRHAWQRWNEQERAEWVKTILAGQSRLRQTSV